jgi:hypothetical protein
MIPAHGLNLTPLPSAESPTTGGRVSRVRHSVQTDLLALVKDTHRKDFTQLAIGDYLEDTVDADRTALARERVAAAGYFTGGELLDGCEA